MVVFSTHPNTFFPSWSACAVTVKTKATVMIRAALEIRLIDRLLLDLYGVVRK